MSNPPPLQAPITASEYTSRPWIDWFTWLENSKIAGWSFDITNVSGDTTLDENMYTVFSDSTLGNIIITLPTAVGILGREYIVKDIGTGGNTTTIDGNGTETIDTNLTLVLASMDTGTVQSNNVNWWIV